MRRIQTGFLLAAFIFTAAAAASAQTADEIIEKTVTAMGGRAALSKITSRVTKGTMTVGTENGDIPATVEITQQAPNKSRRYIVLDLSQFGMGTSTVDQRFDGTSGYLLDAMRGNSALTGSQLENLRNNIFPTPFLDYKERGTKIALAGKDKVGDKDAFVLSVTPTTGPVVKLYVDAQTYLPARTVVTLDIPEIGPQEQSTDLSDYRDVDGIKVPFLVKASSSIQTITITVKSVEQNVKIDPALFSKPVDK